MKDGGLELSVFHHHHLSVLKPDVRNKAGSDCETHSHWLTPQIMTYLLQDGRHDSFMGYNLSIWGKFTVKAVYCIALLYVCINIGILYWNELKHLSKAFYSVDHMFKKSIYADFRFKWFWNYLVNQNQCVHAEEYKSAAFLFYFLFFWVISVKITLCWWYYHIHTCSNLTLHFTHC